MIEWLAMGGYGFYVWMSYGMLAIAIIAELAGLFARRRQAREQVEHDELDEDRYR